MLIDSDDLCSKESPIGCRDDEVIPTVIVEQSEHSGWYKT